MKLKSLLLICVALFFTSALFSQNQKKDFEKFIVGKWKVDSLEIGNFNLAPQYEAIIKEKLPQIIESTEVIFYPNKKYYKKGFEGTTEGTWTMSKDGQYISVKIKGKDKEDRTKVILLTNNKLILAPDDENAVNSKAYMYKVDN